MIIMVLNEVANLTEDLRELKVRKMPFGKFAGTVYRLVVLHNGGSLAMDTGDHGGGQN